MYTRYPGISSTDINKLAEEVIGKLRQLTAMSYEFFDYLGTAFTPEALEKIGEVIDQSKGLIALEEAVKLAIELSFPNQY